MSAKDKFQSQKIDYPKKLYAISLMFRGDNFMALHQNKVFDDVDKAKDYAKLCKGMLRKKLGDDIDVLDEYIIFELQFEKSYKLKKTLWESIDVSGSDMGREYEFVKAVTQPDLYYFVITPAIYAKKADKNNLFLLALCVIKSFSEDEMDTLMKATDLYVAPEAKTAGLYVIKRVLDSSLNRLF